MAEKSKKKSVKKSKKSKKSKEPKDSKKKRRGAGTSGFVSRKKAGTDYARQTVADIVNYRNTQQDQLKQLRNQYTKLGNQFAREQAIVAELRKQKQEAAKKEATRKIKEAGERNVQKNLRETQRREDKEEADLVKAFQKGTKAFEEARKRENAEEQKKLAKGSTKLKKTVKKSEKFEGDSYMQPESDRTQPPRPKGKFTVKTHEDVEMAPPLPQDEFVDTMNKAQKLKPTQIRATKKVDEGASVDMDLDDAPFTRSDINREKSKKLTTQYRLPKMDTDLPARNLTSQGGMLADIKPTSKKFTTQGGMLADIPSTVKDTTDSGAQTERQLVQEQPPQASLEDEIAKGNYQITPVPPEPRSIESSKFGSKELKSNLFKEADRAADARERQKQLREANLAEKRGPLPPLPEEQPPGTENQLVPQGPTPGTGNQLVPEEQTGVRQRGGGAKRRSDNVDDVDKLIEERGTNTARSAKAMKTLNTDTNEYSAQMTKLAEDTTDQGAAKLLLDPVGAAKGALQTMSDFFLGNTDSNGNFVQEDGLIPDQEMMI